MRAASATVRTKAGELPRFDAQRSQQCDSRSVYGGVYGESITVRLLTIRDILLHYGSPLPHDA
jgi:hypothetical protein